MSNAWDPGTQSSRYVQLIITVGSLNRFTLFLSWVRTLTGKSCVLVGVSSKRGAWPPTLSQLKLRQPFQGYTYFLFLFCRQSLIKVRLSLGHLVDLLCLLI